MTGYGWPRPLCEDDDTSSFDSGEPSLNTYLRTRALTNHLRGASRCFVTCREGRVVGYYSLAAASVERQDAPGRIRRNMPEPIPVILLSRLAVDSAHQGVRLGKHLLRDAIARCVQAADVIGARAILVHALDDVARAFYAKFDFETSPTDPLHLMLLIHDARVPDVRTPEVAAEAHRQSVAIATSEHEADDQAFVDAVSDDWTAEGESAE